MAEVDADSLKSQMACTERSRSTSGLGLEPRQADSESKKYPDKIRI